MTLNFNELALKRNYYLCIQKLHLFLAGLAVPLGLPSTHPNTEFRIYCPKTHYNHFNQSGSNVLQNA
jgi:hypothetical protein